VLVDYSGQLKILDQIRSKNNPFLVRFSQFSDCKPICAFLSEMNKNAARLSLKATLLDSPHGLMNANSRSTAYDVARLAAVCLED